MKEAILRIKPRYYRRYTDPGVEPAERNFRYKELDWEVPLAEAAVVCVDVWNDFPHSRDTLERTDMITRTRIVPLIDVCRKGLQVVHAPARPVAPRHRNWVRLVPENEARESLWPRPGDWPPAEFREKKGRYQKYAQPHEPQQAERERHRDEKRDFHPLVRPVGDDPVIINGEELHRLCSQRGVLHLFYVGFHANMCIITRDYGTMAMWSRGYHVILVRDCTTGMETHETQEGLICTRGAIATLEQINPGIYTVTSEQLIRALDNQLCFG